MIMLEVGEGPTITLDYELVIACIFVFLAFGFMYAYDNVKRIRNKVRLRQMYRQMYRGRSQDPADDLRAEEKP